MSGRTRPRDEAKDSVGAGKHSTYRDEYRKSALTCDLGRARRSAIAGELFARNEKNHSEEVPSTHSPRTSSPSILAASAPDHAPVTIEAGTATTDYFSEVRGRIQGGLRYPRSLQMRRLSGRVEIAVTLLPSGALRDVHLTRTSGHTELDRLVLDSAQSAAPFPAFPGAHPRTAILPIDFSLK